MGNFTSGRTPLGGTHTGQVPDPNRKYQIERIQDWYQEAMRLMVLGWDNASIANHFGVSKAVIISIRNSDLTRRQIDCMQAARNRAIMGVQEKLDDSSTKAADVLDSMLNDPGIPAAVRKGVAFGILDRTGHGPTTKIEGKMSFAVFGPEDLKELQRRRDAAAQQGITVEFEDNVEKTKEQAACEG
jgi:hypothetical protein